MCYICQAYLHVHIHVYAVGKSDLEKVLDSLWIIAVTFSADSLHLLHLPSLAGRLARQKCMCIHICSTLCRVSFRHRLKGWQNCGFSE